MNTAFISLKKLQVQPGEWWVAGLVRLPGWVKDDLGKPYRLWFGLCTSKEFGLDCIDPVRPEHKTSSMVAEAVVRHSLRAGRLPAEIHVWEEPVAEFLRQQFQSAELPVIVHVGEKHPVVDTIMEDMASFTAPEVTPKPVPGLLTGSGVTLDQVRCFADASVLFCQATPWRVFDSDEDLLKIDSPSPPPRMRYFAVMGRAGQEYGIAFYDQPEEFITQRNGQCSEADLARRTVIYMSLAEIHEIPFADADLYEDHNLPQYEGKVMLPALVSPCPTKTCLAFPSRAIRTSTWPSLVQFRGNRPRLPRTPPPRGSSRATRPALGTLN